MKIEQANDRIEHMSQLIASHLEYYRDKMHLISASNTYSCHEMYTWANEDYGLLEEAVTDALNQIRPQEDTFVDFSMQKAKK
jgi:hypothetical protein